MPSLSKEESFIKDQFISELLRTYRTGMEAFIKELDTTDFYSSMCVGHDRYRGGVVSHSLWVLYVARNLLSKQASAYPGVSDVNLVIACLLHDLGDIHKGVVHYGGHGRRAALILNDAIKKYGLDITDEELSAIRFHRGHRIVDDFDKHLDSFSRSPLIRILKKADHTAAGVMNGIPFGVKPVDTPLLSKDHYSQTAIYNPDVHHWYIDTNGYSMEYYPTKKGNVNPASLTHRISVELFIELNLFHGSAYDLKICRDSEGHLGVFTVVSDSMGSGDLYRSDHKGFGYKKVVVYFNKFASETCAHFIVSENIRGNWSVVQLTHPAVVDENRYNEFIKRDLKIKGRGSEREALEAFRESHHGIDLQDKDYYERIVVI